MISLSIRSLRKTYGALTVLHGVDLDIRSGEFIVFVGPSGSGKSTLLRIIAGLEEVSSGEIAIDGKVVNDTAPAERGIAMAFQSYALYPHMTVRENMSFGLKTAKMPKATIEKCVAVAADMLQLTAHRDRLPKQLSVGQRQRVPIGRAITLDRRQRSGDGRLNLSRARQANDTLPVGIEDTGTARTSASNRSPADWRSRLDNAAGDQIGASTA